MDDANRFHEGIAGCNGDALSLYTSQYGYWWSLLNVTQCLLLTWQKRQQQTGKVANIVQFGCFRTASPIILAAFRVQASVRAGDIRKFPATQYKKIYSKLLWTKMRVYFKINPFNTIVSYCSGGLLRQMTNKVGSETTECWCPHEFCCFNASNS